MLNYVSTESFNYTETSASTEVLIQNWKLKINFSFIQRNKLQLTIKFKWLTKTIPIHLPTKFLKASIIYYKRLVTMTSTMKKLKVKMEGE